MGEFRIKTDYERDMIEKNQEPLVALLRIAGKLEALLHMKLFYEKNNSLKDMKMWTLGTLIQKSKHILGDDYKSLFTFKEFRNFITHDLSRLAAFENSKVFDKPIQETKVIEILLAACDFIDRNKAVTRGMGVEKMIEYSKYLDSKAKEVEKIVNEF